MLLGCLFASVLLILSHGNNSSQHIQDRLLCQPGRLHYLNNEMIKMKNQHIHVFVRFLLSTREPPSSPLS